MELEKLPTPVLMQIFGYTGDKNISKLSRLNKNINQKFRNNQFYYLPYLKISEIKKKQYLLILFQQENIEGIKLLIGQMDLHKKMYYKILKIIAKNGNEKLLDILFDQFIDEPKEENLFNLFEMAAKNKNFNVFLRLIKTYGQPRLPFVYYYFGDKEQHTIYHLLARKSIYNPSMPVLHANFWKNNPISFPYHNLIPSKELHDFFTQFSQNPPRGVRLYCGKKIQYTFADIYHDINQYIVHHKLVKNRIINLDTYLRNVLKVPINEELTYYRLPYYILQQTNVKIVV